MALHQALYKALTRPILIRLKTESDTHIAKGTGGRGRRVNREKDKTLQLGQQDTAQERLKGVSFVREKMSM